MKKITAHQDSYLNLSDEILSVYPTTIYYPWTSSVAADNKHEILDGYYTFVGLEAPGNKYVLSVDAPTENILEVNSINTSFENFDGWIIGSNSTADSYTLDSYDTPVQGLHFFARLYSSTSTTEEMYLETVPKNLFANSTVTISFYCKASDYVANGITLKIYNNSNIIFQQNLNVEHRWKRFETTFTASGIQAGDLQKIRISVNFNGYVDITGVQLENNNFATSWWGENTPRPGGFVKLATADTYPELFPQDQIVINTFVKFRQILPLVGQTIIGCPTGGYKLWKNPGGFIEFRVNLFDGTSARAKFNQSFVEDKKWHMITGMFMDKKISIYLDGVLMDSQPTSELIYYKDDTVNNIKSKELFIGIDPSLVLQDKFVRALFFQPRNNGDNVNILTFNAGSKLFYDDSSTTKPDFYFYITEHAGDYIFHIPRNAPTNTNNQVWVFLNGILLQENEDYSIIDNVTNFDIQLINTSSISTGDQLQVYLIEDSTTTNIVRYDSLATAGQTEFNVTYVQDGQHLVVFCNGLQMSLNEDYIEENNKISFNTPREADDKITLIVLNGTNKVEHQHFISFEGQTSYLLNPPHDINDSILVFSNGMLNISEEDYTASTQDIPNILVRNTRIEPGRYNIINSFVNFISPRKSGDIVDIVHLVPYAEVSGAFIDVIQVSNENNIFDSILELPSDVNNNILIFVNGLLYETNNYNIINNNNKIRVVFDTNKRINDIIKIVVINESVMQLDRSSFTASAGQTTFNIGSYQNDLQHLLVYTNGLRNSPNNDYQEIDGTSISFISGRQAGDLITAVKIITGDFTRDTYNVSSDQYKFNFSTEYNYFVESLVSSNGLEMSKGKDYITTELGEVTRISVNSQIIQIWYQNEFIYDWRYKKVIA